MSGWIVFVKESVDNLRDRRAVFSSLLMGPIFGPVIFAIAITASLKIATGELEKPLELAVIGTEHAPNFVSWLEQRDVDIVDTPADPEQAVRDGDLHVVLEIPESFAESFRAGVPAPLRIIVDESNRKAQSSIRRARGLVEAWAEGIGRTRLLARGVNPMVTSPVALEVVDLASPEARAALILGMLPYFIVMSMLMGGFYLAIDTTAGERERGSLEALLTTPLSRGELVGGKIAATTVFSMLGLGLAVIAFWIVMPFVPLDEIGMPVSFTARMGLAIFLINLPFALFGAALLTVVAAFTRSFKEAQTWLSVVIIVPAIPIFITAFLPFQPAAWMMTVPSLSQGVLVNQSIKGEPLDMLHLGVSVVSTLLLGLALAALATRLYKREAVLG